MRTPQELQPTVTMETVKVQENRLILQAQVCLERPLPEQDADLPKRLEAGIERAGQTLKRRLFQHAIERADAELLLAQRHGKQGQGIICRRSLRGQTREIGKFAWETYDFPYFPSLL